MKIKKLMKVLLQLKSSSWYEQNMKNILFLTFLILSCEAAPPVTHPSNPNYYNYSPDQNAPFHRMTKSDQKIYDRIRRKLWVWFEKGYEGQIKIDIINGDITLNGEVGSVWEKDDIEHKVRSTEGVRRINNQITVHAPIW